MDTGVRKDHRPENLDSVFVPLPSSGRKATRGISSQELGQGLSGEEQDGASGGVTVGM